MDQPRSFPSLPANVPNECWHLASGAYRAKIASLCVKYPNLRYADPKLPVQGSVGKVVSLEIDGEMPIRRDFEDAVKLQSYIRANRTPIPTEKSHRRLFLVEGLEPRLIGVLGQHFDLDPMLLARQQRTASWESYHRSGNTPSLPSLLEPNRSFHLPYYELHHYPQGLPDKLDWRCADSGRQISSSRMPGTFDRVGIVDRKVSYWSQIREHGGWDGSSSSGFYLLRSLCNVV